MRAVLLKGEEARSAWQEWQQSNNLDGLDAGSQRLLPLLYRNLRALGVDYADTGRRKGLYRRTWYQNRVALHHAEAAIASLEGARIPTVALKGLALLACEYDGDYGARPMSDIDILVRRTDLARAATVLRGLGWRPMVAPAKPLAARVNSFHGTALTDGTGRVLDLHWHVMEEACRRGDDQAFWAGARPAELGGRATRVLAPEDRLLHACVHGSRWDPIPPIRWVADAMAVLETSGGVLDWHRLGEQARRLEVTLSLGHCLAYLRDHLGAAVPADVVQDLLLARVSRLERLDYVAQGKPATIPWAAMRYLARYLRSSRGRPLSRRIWAVPGYLQELWLLDSPWQVPADGVRRVWARARQVGLRVWRPWPAPAATPLDQVSAN